MRLPKLLLTIMLAALLLAACGDDPTSVPATATPAPQGAAATNTTGSVATTATTGAAAATATTGVYSGATEKVRLALDWTPNINHVGFYVALANGWFKEEGVDLEILPYSEANTPDALVAAGQAEMGISFTESLVADYAVGLPVKSVAAIAQHNTSALVTLKSSGLDSPDKLAGKRYAGFGAPYEQPVISTMMTCKGGTTTDFQNITANVFGYQALTAGQADFVWIFMGVEGIQAKREGIDLNVFYIKDYCVPDYYTPIIIGSNDFLSSKPDLAKRALKAISRGYEYAITNPKEAADLMIAQTPSGTFPDADFAHESAEYMAPIFKGEVPQWGAQARQMFTDYPKFMFESGHLLGSDGQAFAGDLTFGDLYTNDYLP